jgi:hypothetical protein
VKPARLFAAAVLAWISVMAVMAGLMLLLASLGGCGAIRDPEPPVPAGWVLTPVVPRDAVERLHRASVVVPDGTVTRIRADWMADDPCGVFAALQGRCDGTRAYDLTIRTPGGDLLAMIFVPHWDFNPVTVGLRAEFLLSTVSVLPLARCRAVQAMTSTACQTMATRELAILSTDDIWPLNTTTPK